MDNDTISRQAAIEEIEPYTDNIYNSTAIEIKEILQRLPSVQPKQKTGRWIYMKDCEDWFCSNCKDIFMLLEGTPKDNDYNYCPNCGAFMKGESNDKTTSN